MTTTGPDPDRDRAGRVDFAGSWWFSDPELDQQAFDVEASTDLTGWSKVATVTNLTGTLVFDDPIATNAHPPVAGKPALERINVASGQRFQGSDQATARFGGQCPH
jgi:hypothetical protein